MLGDIPSVRNSVLARCNAPPGIPDRGSSYRGRGGGFSGLVVAPDPGWARMAWEALAALGCSLWLGLLCPGPDFASEQVGSDVLGQPRELAASPSSPGRSLAPFSLVERGARGVGGGKGDGEKEGQDKGMGGGEQAGRWDRPSEGEEERTWDESKQTREEEVEVGDKVVPHLEKLEGNGGGWGGKEERAMGRDGGGAEGALCWVQKEF